MLWIEQPGHSRDAFALRSALERQAKAGTRLNELFGTLDAEWLDWKHYRIWLCSFWHVYSICGVS